MDLYQDAFRRNWKFVLHTVVIN